MAAYRRVYDSHHLQAGCQDPGLGPEPYTLGNRVWATFFTETLRIALQPNTKTHSLSKSVDVRRS